MDRPQILPKQNLSPQGEKLIISLREIRKTAFFGGRFVNRPYRLECKLKFFDSLTGPPKGGPALVYGFTSALFGQGSVTRAV